LEAKERKMSQQQLMVGYPDEDKNALWDAKWALGLFDQDKER
jgi:hypothetical protein